MANVKVTVLKDVSLGSLNRTFVEGQECEIPSDEAKKYPQYFKKIATKTTKNVETEENK